MILPADITFSDILPINNMKKIFKNSSGNIIVQSYSEEKEDIVRLIQLRKKEGEITLGYWENRASPCFVSLGDNFIKTKYDFDIFKALKFGQKLAEILIETKNEK